MFRFGTLVKREYRGQRSADALANYVRDAVKDNIKRVQNLDDLDNLDVSDILKPQFALNHCNLRVSHRIKRCLFVGCCNVVQPVVF